MRLLGIVAGAALFGGAALAGSAAAQSPAPSQQPAELVSEMWALAGICSQYPSYTVRNEALAAWLNNTINGHDQAEVIRDRHTAKLAEISANVADLTAMRRGSAREQRSDEHTAALMTRCRRLTNDPVASAYFLNSRR